MTKTRALPALDSTSRRARVRDLFLLHGLDETQISEAIRTPLKQVRRDIAQIRKALGKAGDPVPTQALARLTYSYRRLVNLIEDDSETTTRTKSGDTITTTTRPTVSAGVREKCLRSAALVAERIAVLQGVGKGADLPFDPPPSFTMVFPADEEAELKRLIAGNLPEGMTN